MIPRGKKLFWAVLLGLVALESQSALIGNALSDDKAKNLGTMVLLSVLSLYGLIRLLRPSGRRGEAAGKKAERQVQKTLNSLARKHPEYKVFHNVIFQDDRFSAEIDHIVVSPYGVFVIETKAYANSFVDDEGGWYTNRKGTTPMRSPLDQNHGHIKALRDVIGKADYFNVVVMTESVPEGKCPNNVVTMKALIPSIRLHRDVVMDQSAMSSYIDRLRGKNRSNERDVRKEHLRRARNRKDNTHARTFDKS